MGEDQRTQITKSHNRKHLNLREKLKLRKIAEPHTNSLFSQKDYKREERTSQPLYNSTRLSMSSVSYTLMTVHPFL